MFLSLNQKSIALATAILVSSMGQAMAQSNTQEVSIDFQGWVGEDEFVCGESYDRVGSSETTVTPTDFRLYVSQVALIDRDGNTVPVELEQDGKWQYKNVALLDFEDGSGACDNGTTETNTAIVGSVPEGDYEGLQFTLGVPKQLNHNDAAIAPSPLNLTSMWWNWQGGYKFLRADLETDSAIANVANTSSTASSQNGENNVQIDRQTTSSTSQGGSQNTTQTSNQTSLFKNGRGSHSQTSSTRTSSSNDGSHNSSDVNHQASSNSYLIHIGSTGCKDSAQSDLFGCANPNRSTIVLEDFNPEDNVVIVDLAELLYESDLSTNQANTPTGCMSAPEDSDCSPIMQGLGLSFDGATSAEGQRFFFVE